MFTKCFKKFHKIKNSYFYRVYVKISLKIFFDLFYWTKKCYFFHALSISTILLLLLLLLGPNILNSGNIENSGEIVSHYEDLSDISLLSFMAVVTYYLSYVTFFIAILIEVLRILISIIKRKGVYVKSKFLLENNYYNIYYILSLLWIIFCNIACRQ